MGIITLLLFVGLFVAVIVMAISSKKSKSSSKKSDSITLEPMAPRAPRQMPDYDEPTDTANGNDPISPLAKFNSKQPLTQREATCYWSLVKNLHGHYVVLPQVAFSAFLYVDGADKRSNLRRFATMRQKVADFLIVRKDFTIVALIELDDSSHATKKDADRQRDAAIKEAGIRVFRIPRVPHSDQVQRLCDVLIRLDLQQQQ